MDYLVFQPFIPVSGGKDLSGLESVIRNSRAYSIESKDAVCAFVRGSSVSSFESTLMQAHPNSDVDLTVVSRTKKRYVNQYRERLCSGCSTIEIPIDVANLTQGSLEKEISGYGANGATSLFSFTHDSYPLDNVVQYTRYREAALIVFLRIGLQQYRQATHLTPSGAMKAINQAKLLINPLRWWSIEYSFRISNSAGQNISRYYEDVAAMLHLTLDLDGKFLGEDLYRIPDNFRLDTPIIKLKLDHFLSKLDRFHSTPFFSLNDLHKARNKLRSLVVGVMEGKTDMDRLFESGASPNIASRSN